MGNTVYWMPPYIIEQDDMDLLVGATCALLDTME
jgi:adenosylmethionine-8-amino-7-oxononanoate aminotransferase